MQIVVDIAIGEIPVVGTAVDIAELLYAVVFGEDKWGNPLSTGDLALLGLGAVLPFVSGSALRASRRLVQRFSEHTDDASELVKRVKQANLSAEEVAVIQQLEAMIKAGGRPSTELWNKAIVIMRRIPGPRPTMGVVLNADHTGFAHAELQDAYQRYAATQIRKGLEVKDAAEWARYTRGRAYQIFVTLLGPDYAKTQRSARMVGRPVNNVDVPRPDTYVDARFAANLNTAEKDPRLWERLGKLQAEPPEPGAASVQIRHRQVSAEQFGYLKGNLAEILSNPIKNDQLARIAKEMAEKGEEGIPVLVSGVMVRLAKEGTPKKLSGAKLFSDDVILVMRGKHTKMKAAFEVKSGYKGGQEATEQVYGWIETKFTEGSQLVLPKGCTFRDPLGNTWTSTEERFFIWHPTDPKAPTVTGLAGAERHIIAAEGTSLLGINSEKGIGPNVARHSLDQTSEELDYLAASIFLGRTAPIKKVPLAAQ